MTVQVECKLRDSNARLPAKTHGDTFGYGLQNLYTTLITPGSSAKLTAGLIMNSSDNLIAVVAGQFPARENEFIGVLQRFIPLGNELQVEVQNGSHVDVEYDAYQPLTRMFLVRASGGDPIIADELGATIRGESGFGSSGLI